MGSALAAAFVWVVKGMWPFFLVAIVIKWLRNVVSIRTRLK